MWIVILRRLVKVVQKWRDIVLCFDKQLEVNWNDWWIEIDKIEKEGRIWKENIFQYLSRNSFLLFILPNCICTAIDFTSMAKQYLAKKDLNPTQISIRLSRLFKFIWEKELCWLKSSAFCDEKSNESDQSQLAFIRHLTSKNTYDVPFQSQLGCYNMLIVIHNLMLLMLLLIGTCWHDSSSKVKSYHASNVCCFAH